MLSVERLLSGQSVVYDNNAVKIKKSSYRCDMEIFFVAD